MRRSAPIALAAILLAGSAVAWPDATHRTPVRAQADDCIAETEPNDAPETSPSGDGALCVAGSLPAGDQDLLVWDPGSADATRTWTVTLEGVPGALTTLVLMPVTSDPGVLPIAVGSPLLTLDATPETLPGSWPTAEVLLMPHRYLIGVSRAAPADGVEPDDPGYRLRLARGAPSPEALGAEPDDDAATATEVSGAFRLAGDASGSIDVVAWTVDGTPDDGSWTVRFDGALGSGLWLSVRDPSGTEVAASYGDTLGRVVMPDLRLAAGTWTLTVGGGGEQPTPYQLSGQDEPRIADAEPNDLVAAPAPVDLVASPARGRLWPSGDRDRFRFTIADGDGRPLRDLKLLGGGDRQRSLCLGLPDGREIQCRSGTGGVALRSLALSPGEYQVAVTGDPDEERPYLLRLDATADAVPDFEQEPNDLPPTATVFEPRTAMRGVADVGDVDMYRLEVVGEAQLWQIDVTGTELGRLAWIHPDGGSLGEGFVRPDRTAATLTDLYLVPGQHWFRVEGDGEYRIEVTALGPPDPAAEREPNDQAAFAQPYRLGRVDLVGRLPFVTDTDVLRFSLAGTERVAVVVEPPPDGSIDLMVVAGTETLGRLWAAEPGQVQRLDLLLGPGDQEIWLRPGQPSAGRYRLHLERGDPWPADADQEPNDIILAARDLPPSLTASGTLPPGDGRDWYALPPLAPGTSVVVTLTGGASDAEISDGTTSVPVTWSEDRRSLTVDGTSGQAPRFLAVWGSGDYTLAVSAAGLESAPAPAPLELAATLEMSAPAVAAYWPAAQRLTGTLTLRNDGASALALELLAVTSHAGWSAIPETSIVSLAAGEERSVPVTVVAAPDAWADEPVRVTVRATTSEGPAVGGAVTAAALVTPRGDVDPVAAHQGWSVPEELLGGLDVASLALGASTIPSIDPVLEDALHDGFTHTGTGFTTSRANLPVTLTVDLAGEGPVPVAGFALDPHADEALWGDVPRDVELQLSTDGGTWTTAATVRMSTLMADQWVVLPEAVPATHARLRILSVQGAGFDQVILGEWKVIASPGIAVGEAVGLDLAPLARGGHVAWMDPQPLDAAVGAAWLDAGLETTAWFLGDVRTVSWTVGFRNDRAALLTGLQWADAAPAGGERLAKVTVEVSVEGPVGPWMPAGTWALDRAADGTVAGFTFPAPTWARFLRFSGSVPGRDARSLDPPSAISIIEHPTDAGYRSVLGEWGTDSAGPLEWRTPPDLSIPPVVDDTDDTLETAGPLAPDGVTQGRVDGRTDLDWYAFEVPAGHNSVAIEVAGRPVVAVALTLTDPDGLEIPMLFRAGDTPGTVLYEAEVTPGTSYRLKVEQPPSSIVFTFDTSGSMGAYLAYVYQAMRAFAADVTPGEEFVSIVPFEEDPLLPDWSDDPYVLQDAVGRFVAGGGSSSAEAALIAATTDLSAREGAKAVLVVTDAETSSFPRSTELWRILGAVRPLVFSVHVGATAAPPVSSAMMRDWAGVAGGVYGYARTHGEMDRAFDRLATWLRRPAAYTLRLETTFQEKPPPSAEPGTISVDSPADGSVSLSPDVGVEIILDTSGSMLRELRGRPRIELAKAVLVDMVRNRLPAGAPVAVRVLGDATDVCGTRLVVPLGPLDPEAVIADVTAIEVVGEADTPLGQALRAVPDDLAGSTGTRIVLLITDSEEVWPHPDLCGEDPAAAIRDLRRRGIDARLNIVGLQVDARRATRQLRTWARLGNGSFFSAKDADALARSIRTALSAPFRVLDDQGNEIASGTIDGAGVSVPPGTYSVVVLTDPVARFDAIEVGPGESRSVTLPDATPPPSLEPVPTPAP